MNKTFIAQCKMLSQSIDSIVSSVWSALSLEFSRCGWTDEEIATFVTEAQKIWSESKDDALIQDAINKGIDVLDLSGYNIVGKLKFSKQNKIFHKKLRWNVAAVYAATVHTVMDIPKWSTEDAKMLIANTAHHWAMCEKNGKAVEKVCEEKTGFSFQYAGV